jgi:hypothetical protein
LVLALLSTLPASWMLNNLRNASHEMLQQDTDTNHSTRTPLPTNLLLVRSHGLGAKAAWTKTQIELAVSSKITQNRKCSSRMP